MKSHHCDFTLLDLARELAGPLLPVAAFSAAMHLGATWRVLPPPRPTLDLDRTILLHQAAASQSHQAADIVFLGDSSCLMDVSIDDLNRSLAPQHQALNLGTLSYVDLSAQSVLLRHYVRANPGRVRAVVLLLHPESLRRTESGASYTALLDKFYQQSDLDGPGGPDSRLNRCLGLHIFRGRILSYLLPGPLPGAYGRTYGFTTDLWRYLTRHGGSAIDPRRFKAQPGQGNAEYRLSPGRESAARAFKVTLPPGVRLIVGITPAPAGFVAPDYPAQYQRMLEIWSQWLQADMTWCDLPAALPDTVFASPTHLNAEGVRLYTRIIARNLALP